MLKVVDFPAPLLPSRQYISPGRIFRSSPRRATCPRAYSFFSAIASIMVFC